MSHMYTLLHIPMIYPLGLKKKKNEIKIFLLQILLQDRYNIGVLTVILTWSHSFPFKKKNRIISSFYLISTCADECDWRFHWQHKLWPE